MLRSDGLRFCTGSKPALAYDAGWMQALATAQVFLLPIFVTWRHFSVLDVKGPSNSNQEVGKEDDTVAERLRQEAIEVENLRVQVMEARNKYKEKEKAL